MGHQALRDRIHSFDIRPARNALKLVRGELNNLIHHTMLTLTQRTLHGRRAFDILRFSFSFKPLNVEPRTLNLMTER